VVGVPSQRLTLNLTNEISKVYYIHSSFFKPMSNQYIKTDLRGKINNLKDFKSEALLPVFEAVTNSIHAIEDKNNNEIGKITVNIKRQRGTQINLTDSKFENDKSKEESTITGFEIVDNGIGFTKDNYNSFETSDSTYKFNRGGKGIGRFSWLKAFKKVEVKSVYFDEENKKKLRTFNFTIENIIDKHVNNDINSNSTQKTTVNLIGFKKAYRDDKSAYKTTSKIAQRILEHYLTYYIGGIAPKIIVEDDNESIAIDDIYDEIKHNIFTENIEILNHTFSIHHIKLYSTHEKEHKIVYCADNRDVTFDNLNKYFGTSSYFDEHDKKFKYSVYVSGEYLNKHVDASRKDFNLQNGDVVQSTIDDDNLFSIEKIRDAVVEKSKEYLSSYLDIIKEKKNEKISKIVMENPQLRSVLNYFPEVVNDFDVNSTNEKIIEALYKYRGHAELKIKNDSSKLLKKIHVDNIQEIENEYKELSKEIRDFQKDDLAQYLIKRKIIIDLVDRKLQLNKDNKYQTESIIHDILFPRNTSTDQLLFDDHNLWIIDENLVYHKYAYSNKKISDFSTSDSNKLPDIIVFQDVENTNIVKSVSIIELKRPQRVGFEQSPISQMFDIIRDIKKNKIKNVNGRDIATDETTIYYCFAICDLTNFIAIDAVDRGLKELKGNRGYHGYNDTLNAVIEVLAYDQLINDVKKRHKAFFDKLGI
jgi:hypothetical protein